jgi:hypothetical protein
VRGGDLVIFIIYGSIRGKTGLNMTAEYDFQFRQHPGLACHGMTYAASQIKRP